MEITIKEQEIQEEMERLIEISCEMNGSHTPREIAEEVIKLKLGTKRQRAILDFIIKNNVNKALDYHFKYVEE